MTPRRTQAYKELFVAVRATLNGHDPMGLIDLGLPEDEYEPEVGTILPRLKSARSANDVQAIVSEEFAEWFGGISLREATAEAIAVDVWTAWVRFRDSDADA